MTSVTFNVAVAAYDRETLFLMGRWMADMYSRTQNENGTLNTRCLHCLLTIATSVESDEDLQQLELHHMCPERALAELVAGNAATAARASRN